MPFWSIHVRKTFVLFAALALLSTACASGSDTVALGGPPECETRANCYKGLVDVYGLTSLEFEAIAEGSARVSALQNGDIQVAALFSTQPVITENGWVALDDDQGITAAENIVPVVRDEIVEAYGDDMTDVVNEVSEAITTEVLLDLNGRVEIQTEDPDVAATAWLDENGLLPAEEETQRRGPTITVGSFNFGESFVLAEIYAQVLAAHGYPVEKKLDLGSREVIFPSLESGEIDFLPEYIGSALGAGFEVTDIPASSDDGHDLLTEEFAAIDVTVLDYAPGEDKNVYVVTGEFAEEHDLKTISDLKAIVG